MLNCRHANRDYLRSHGYGTITVPKADFKPLILLAPRGDRLAQVGKVVNTFAPGASPLPQIAPNIAVAALSGERTDKLDTKVGLNILGPIIGALAGSALGLTVGYKRTSKVEFEFGDVLEDSVDIDRLDQFLATASVAGAGPFMKQQLEDDAIFIVTSVVHAKTIKIVSSNTDGQSAGVDVPVIQQAVGAKVEVSSENASNSILSYTSKDTPLGFGFKAVRLDFDDDRRGGLRFQSMKIARAKGLVAAAASGAVEDGIVPEDDGQGNAIFGAGLAVADD